MRGMILAAGLGTRMGALTAHTPKALLRVAGKYLIEYAIMNFVRAGVHEIVINVSYQRDQIKSVIGRGDRYGAAIVYSEEPERLETGGGILQALPLLGSEPFLVMSSDIMTDFPLEKLPKYPEGLAHLVLVDNPSFHPEGDFGLRNGRIDLSAEPLLTFGNIGIYHPDLFMDCQLGYFPLSRVLFSAIKNAQVTGEYYQGIWHNIGTAKDLEEMNKRAREDSNLRPLVSETNTLSS